MHAECPLCGRKMTKHPWDTFFPSNSSEISYQITNLVGLHTGLVRGSESVEDVVAERSEVCPLCAEILQDISITTDKTLLKDRIQKALGKLQHMILAFCQLVLGYFWIDATQNFLS